MTKIEFQRIIEDFFPPEDKRIQLDKVVDGCKHRNINIQRRTLQDFSTKGILPKPIRIGRKAYYDVDIFDKIAALFILKDIFHFSHREIKNMLQGGASSLTEIVEALYKLLSEYFNYPVTGNNQPLIFKVANAKKAEFIIKAFVREVSEGVEPPSLNKQNFLDKFNKMRIK